MQLNREGQICKFCAKYVESACIILIFLLIYSQKQDVLNGSYVGISYVRKNRIILNLRIFLIITFSLVYYLSV